MSTVVQENATGVRVVRAFGREKYEMDRFLEKNNAFAQLLTRLYELDGQKGKITIGGKQIKEISLEELRKNLL